MSHQQACHQPVSEELLWELFLQAGPVVSVFLPKDRVSGANQSFGFVEFKGEEDAAYACRVLNMVKLHGQALRVDVAANRRGGDGKKKKHARATGPWTQHTQQQKLRRSATPSLRPNFCFFLR